jgi:hypothetical protein
VRALVRNPGKASQLPPEAQVVLGDVNGSSERILTVLACAGEGSAADA